MTSTYQNLGDIYFFAAYDPVTTQLLYTKYNFLYKEYAIAYNLIGLPKIFIFYDFLIRTDAAMERPFSVKPELVKFFSPITPEIINYFDQYSYTAHPNYMFFDSPTLYLPDQYIYENQFNMIYYKDTEYRRLQDYIYVLGNKYYTQYNFDHDTYSKDFNVWGCWLTVFTDFVVRTIYLNKAIIGSYGYGFPLPSFEKYFYQTDNNALSQYMIDYAVNSIYYNVYKYLFNINFILYGEINLDLHIYNGNYEELKNHYLMYGQFEQRIIPFYNIDNLNTRIELINNYCATIYSGKYISSGIVTTGNNFKFYAGKRRVYIVFCYHTIINITNKNTILASVIYNNDISRKLLFKIIGYDMFTDICVGLYDATLDYNIAFNKDIDPNLISAIDISTFETLESSNEIFTIGNIESYDNSSFLKGSIVDPRYCGTFNSNFSLANPESYLIQMNSSQGMSGSPIFIGDPYDIKTIKCVGMINSLLGNTNQYTIALAGSLLGNIVFNIISRWYSFSFRIQNVLKLNFFIQDGFPKKWLGTLSSYYHQNITPNLSPAFKNFSYNGGVVLEDFIIGYNYINKECIYETLDLVKQGAVKIDTPLLDTRMYNRFIFNGRVPLVLKSITLYDNFYGQYKKFNLGKFKNQVSLDVLTYRFLQDCTLLNDPKYINVTYKQYMTIYLEYYYFNGLEWILDVEAVGKNTADWYNTYTDPVGNLYYQHKFELPLIMLPYLPVYSYYIGNNKKLFPGQDIVLNNSKTAGSVSVNPIPVGLLSHTAGSWANSDSSICINPMSTGF
jgi:hypothetical protein